MNIKHELIKEVGNDGKIDIGDIDAVNSSITYFGHGGIVTIKNGVHLRDTRLRVESPHSIIVLEEGVRFTGSIFLKGTGPNHVFIGPGTTVGQANIICGESSSVSIGADCMLVLRFIKTSTNKISLKIELSH